MDAFVLPIVVAMAMVVDPLSIIHWFKSKLIVRISDFADFALGKCESICELRLNVSTSYT